MHVLGGGADANEATIAEKGGLPPIIAATKSVDVELQSQAARALRNLSVREENKDMIRSLGGVEPLKVMASSTTERISKQASRALLNLGESL